MKGRHFGIILAVTLITFGFAWVRLRIVSISYDINELAKQERALRDECNSLSLKINEAKSPRRLESIALHKYKMQAPRVGQVIVLKDR